jgi:type IV secretory pathway TrbD component
MTIWDWVSFGLGLAIWIFIILAIVTRGRSAEVLFDWIYRVGVRHRKRKGRELPWE